MSPIHSTPWFQWAWNKKSLKFEFLNLGFGGLQKYQFFKSTNYQYFFTKISGQVPNGFFWYSCKFYQTYLSGLCRYKFCFQFTLVPGWETLGVESGANCKLSISMTRLFLVFLLHFGHSILSRYCIASVQTFDIVTVTHRKVFHYLI